MNIQRRMQTVLGILLLVLISWVGQKFSAPAPGPRETAPATVTPPAAPVPAAPAVVPVGEGFDYYVLSLSWSPTHCASEEGRGPDDDLQCRAGRPYGFVLHGLWPQNEQGYPEDCGGDRVPALSREVEAAALGLTPSVQLVRHEWRKHGTCTGLAPADYFAAAAQAVAAVQTPAAYTAPERPLVTSPRAVRAAFLEANPQLPKDGIVVTCRRNHIGEVRVCLDRRLAPRACSREVLKRQCGMREARMLAARGDWPR